MKDKKFIVKDKKSVFIDDEVVIGENVIIYENNRIEGKTIIEDNATIYPNSYIVNSKIGKGTKIYSSMIENSEVGTGCIIGPFAHLRPKSKLGSFVKVGNFCEIKNSIVGNHTKISHLAYVGDAKIGSSCNIGCGAIFVNYNGKTKSKTVVGNRAFIGSNVNLIAPVFIDDGAYICAGTTIDKDVKSNSFVIGRVHQEEKENRALKYLNKEKS